MASIETEPSVFTRPGFHWDAQDVYLFDIDGTLLLCRDHIHVASFLTSVRAVTGLDLTLDGVTMSGNTDPGILRDAFRLARLESALWEPRVAEILERMRREFASRRGEMRIDKMPGVDDVLEHLHHQGAILGLATGNLEAIGWIKVEFLNLRHWFAFGSFSDRFTVRTDMVAHAAGLARTLAGPKATLCIVGDTPADITAARANGIPAVTMATGRYSFEQLMEHKPDACATNFPALLAATRT